MAPRIKLAVSLVLLYSVALTQDVESNTFKNSFNRETELQKNGKPILHETDNLFLFQKNKEKEERLNAQINDNNKQKLDSIKWQEWDENTGTWSDVSKNLYHYEGNTVQQTKYNRDLNSGVWEEFTKNEFTYDEGGNVTNDIFSTWNGNTKSWNRISKTAYNFSENDQETKTTHYTWDETGSRWKEDRMNETFYDTNGNITTYIQYKWWDEATSQWVPDDKEESTYDTNGNKVQSILYKWDETKDIWEKNSKTEFTFNTTGNLAEYILYNWNKTTEAWDFNLKTEYTYDGDENNAQFISYRWDETSKQWVNSSKSEFTYDTNGNILQSLSYSWSKATQEWVFWAKNDNMYDAENRLTKTSRYSWDNTNSKWKGLFQYEYTYDTKGNRTVNSYFRWDNVAADWKISTEKGYTYDPLTPGAELLFPDVNFLAAINYPVVSKLLSIETSAWDDNLSGLKPSEKNVLYYSEIKIYKDTTKASICKGDSYVFRNITYSEDGFYSDTLFSFFGLDTVLSLLLEVYPEYQPEIVAKGDTLKAVSEYNSFQWYNGNGAISGANKKEFIISKSGSYYLRIIDENGCENTSETINIIYSAIEIQTKNDLDFSVFPNPNSGIFMVRFNTHAPDGFQLHVFNPIGQIVDHRTIRNPSENHFESFDVSHLSKGIYTLKLSAKKKNTRIKIVVQ